MTKTWLLLRSIPGRERTPPDLKEQHPRHRRAFNLVSLRLTSTVECGVPPPSEVETATMVRRPPLRRLTYASAALLALVILSDNTAVSSFHVGSAAFRGRSPRASTGIVLSTRDVFVVRGPTKSCARLRARTTQSRLDATAAPPPPPRPVESKPSSESSPSAQW